MKSGFVTIIGRPNVGKSTLINQIIGSKVAITSSKPQTTRNMIKGIYNDEETQIVFMDTPGIHKARHKLGAELNRQAYYTINDVDIILFVVDISTDLGGGDKYILNALKDVNKPVILVLNKIDGLSNAVIFNKILQYKDLYNFSEIVPISALKDKNIPELIKVIKEYLPDNIKYYEDDTVTTKPLDFIMAEVIREKVFRLTHEEVPHSVAVVVEDVEVSKTSYVINASIIVDRDALKRIIIGSGGSMIKKIGIQARVDLEEILNRKVFLNLFVKVEPKWRDKETKLKEYGYYEFE